MEIIALKNKFLFSFCFSIIILFFSIGCHPKNDENMKSIESKTIDNSEIEFLVTNDIYGSFSPKHTVKLKEILANRILPIVSGTDKAVINRIIRYLGDIQKESPSYFESSKNSIEFIKTIMQLHLMSAKYNPDNFDLNLNVAVYYMMNGNAIKGMAQSEEDQRLSEEYMQKGLKASKYLVDHFPKNSMSYAQLAHSLYITGGDKKEMTGLLGRCLEIDPDSQYCQDFLDTVGEDVDSTSP